MIYFIQTESGPIKIGYTSGTLENRLKKLQTGSVELLRPIGWLTSGNIQHERRLHWKFRNVHVRGEFFRPVDRLVEIVEYDTPFDVFNDLLGYESEENEYEITYDKVRAATKRAICPACDQTIQPKEQIATVGCAVVHLECAQDPPAIDFMPGAALLDPLPRPPRTIKERKQKRKKYTKRTASMRKAYERQLSEGLLTIKHVDDSITSDE